MLRELCAVFVVSCLLARDVAAVTEVEYENVIQRIVQLETQVEELTTGFRSNLMKILTLEEASATAETGGLTTGVSYIRWGRRSCPGDATLVYNGHAAGAHYNEGGGGANILCLHENSQWNVVFPGFSSITSRIYGVEYALDSANYVFSMNNSGGYTLNDYPAPCVACHVRNRTSVLMIPARIDCPYGWTEEYQGYMVAEVSTVATRHRSQYTCWDEAPESAEGAAAQNQAMIYTVEVGSGSLPSSIYVNGTELTCVVCSK